MPQWGRAGAGHSVASAEAAMPRYARRSVLMAIVAFAIGAAGVAVFALTPKDVSETVGTTTTVAFMIALFGVAPLVHVVGFVFGLVALVRPHERKGVAVLGILLNCISLMIGGAFIYIMFANMGRFT